MLILAREKGQYLVFDFSNMSDADLLALKHNPMAIKVVQGSAKLACATEKGVQIYRHELLNDIAPDIVEALDAKFEAAGIASDQRRYAKQNGHDSGVPATTEAEPRILATPKERTAAELARANQLPTLKGVRDPAAPVRRRVGSL